MTISLSHSRFKRFSGRPDADAVGRPCMTRLRVAPLLFSIATRGSPLRTFLLRWMRVLAKAHIQASRCGPHDPIDWRIGRGQETVPDSADQSTRSDQVRHPNIRTRSRPSVLAPNRRTARSSRRIASAARRSIEGFAMLSSHDAVDQQAVEAPTRPSSPPPLAGSSTPVTDQVDPDWETLMSFWEALMRSLAAIHT